MSGIVVAFPDGPTVSRPHHSLKKDIRFSSAVRINPLRDPELSALTGTVEVFCSVRPLQCFTSEQLARSLDLF